MYMYKCIYSCVSINMDMCMSMHIHACFFYIQTAVISIDIPIDIAEIFSFFNYIKTFVSCDMNTYHDMMSNTINSLCEILATTHHYELLYLFAVKKFHVFNFCCTWLPTKHFSC